MTRPEDTLAWQLEVWHIAFEREFHAIPGRRYRWDFRIGDILIEVQGGTWADSRSGHSTGAGIKRDCEKLNLATLHGWRVLAFTTDMVYQGEAIEQIKACLEKETN